MLLRKVLSEKDPTLFARLQVVETKANQFLEYSQGGAHLTYTPHGLSHISAVEDSYDWLLSDDDVEKLNPMELFCLLCSTFFHDALMIPKRIGDEHSARTEHAIRAKDFLLANRDYLGLSIHEANAVSQIILGHSLDDLDRIEEQTVLGSTLVEIHKLAACLSIADICHADASRAPEIVFRHLDLDEDSAKHWRRHLQISGITRKDQRLMMSALYFSDEGLEAIHEYKIAIEKQLNVVRPYFNAILTPITGVDLQANRLNSQLDVPLKFQANMVAILDILIEGVYQREDVFIRELVQNSLDACHLRLARAMRRSEDYQPQVIVSTLSSRGTLKGIRIDDNGIGMDIADVQDTLLWIGNSIAKREEVKTLLRETTGKDLIATFGIGLLSCFKVAEDIFVRTKKEGRDPIEFNMKAVSEQVPTAKGADPTTGSTFIIEFKRDIAKEIDVAFAISYYFRMIPLASFAQLELDSVS